jgi:hypothetical protein
LYFQKEGQVEILTAPAPRNFKDAIEYTRDQIGLNLM